MTDVLLYSSAIGKMCFSIMNWKLLISIFFFTKSFQGGQFNIKVQKHFLGSKWYHLNSYWKKKDEANAYNEVNLDVQFFIVLISSNNTWRMERL